MISEECRKLVLASVILLCFSTILSRASGDYPSRAIRVVNNGVDDVVWVVQVSDLHFSVHHPERALLFKEILGRALSIINPSLVLITGDLTDGKSKDLLTMRQNKVEWSEYNTTMRDTVSISGLSEDMFYDLRGNHDKFGVLSPNSAFDFFSRYSISAHLNRTGNVKTITLMNSGRKHLFVALDTSMAVGLRGPTNLFGHLTNEVIEELDRELSLWDAEPSKPSKIVFGHFPLSFTAASETGNRLKHIFAKHSITAYLCGHLHTKFGRNLFKHHFQAPTDTKAFPQYFQLQAHYMLDKQRQCHDFDNQFINEFWEWEMGDWRKTRTMRVIAIDKGHTSFVDFDYGMMVFPFVNASMALTTFVVPTFPLDSRMMLRLSRSIHCNCALNSSSCHEPIRALVFSSTSVTSVKAKIYDSVSGAFQLIMEMKMTKHSDVNKQGGLYVSDSDWLRFIDPSANSYWLEVEAIEDSGKPVSSPLRPFSISMKASPLKWTWSEFLVMGCEWDLLYEPLLWLIFTFILMLLLSPKVIDTYFGSRSLINTWNSDIFTSKKFSYFFFKIPLWILVQASRNNLLWWSEVVYVLYLILFPWFYGQVIEEDNGTSYMSHQGWTISLPDIHHHYTGIGVPDIMVIVLPHLYLVVFPLICVVSFFVSEKVAFKIHSSLKSEKKEYEALETKRRIKKNCKGSCILCGRWIRKTLFGICFLILCSHAKRSHALIHAYGAKGVLSSAGFVWPVLIIMALAVWRTK